MAMGVQDPGSGNGRPMMADINVTPFVDVMLVLLVIFMITTPMMVTGLEVNLPDADAPPMQSTDVEQLVLSVTADGTYAIADRPFSFDELATKLRALHAVNPDQALFVKADGQVPYERVAALIAVASDAGFLKVGLVTEPMPPDGPR